MIGCKYQSTMDLIAYAYWLFNGTDGVKKMKMNRPFEEGIHMREFELPTLTISSFEMIGDYQCVIENKFIRSGKLVSKVAKANDLKGNMGIGLTMMKF